ncbi:MAG: S-layer homology domain-containing protein, partial [Promicromonosporaceae bacterium]|nr:S-layer homology domain-containing protein [Promicromonosporaceae bacterium]
LEFHCQLALTRRPFPVSFRATIVGGTWTGSSISGDGWIRWLAIPGGWLMDQMFVRGNPGEGTADLITRFTTDYFGWLEYSISCSNGFSGSLVVERTPEIPYDFFETRDIPVPDSGELHCDVVISPTTAPEPGDQPFVDVPETSPFFADIEWMVERGITTGWPVEDGQAEFRPGANITREAMAAFLYRAAGRPDFTPPVVPTFADVSTGSPFYKEVEWLATQGITDGWTVDGVREFRPGANITREAMAAFLYRAAGEPDFTPPATPSFVDVPSSSPFYKQVEWMAATGISTGWNEPTGREFRPAAFITREATAAFLHRASVIGGGIWG